MVRIVQGEYYSGLNSKANPVSISLYQNQMVIHPMESMSRSMTDLKWNIADVTDVDFSSSSIVQLTYGDFPKQTIIIRNHEDVQAFHETYPEIGKRSIYFNILKANIAKMLAVTSSFLIGLVLFYFFIAAPFIATRAVHLIPKSAEVLLGDQMSDIVLSEMDFDEEKSKHLDSFFHVLGFESEYPIELFVVDDPTVNAFAIPGGKIVVFQGILDKMDDWKELAGLLGHELAHVELRHSLKAICRKIAIYIPFSVISGDLSGISAIIVENSSMLNELSNTRAAEKEADLIGYQYLLEQQIDPQGMVDLFETILEEENEMAGLRSLKKDSKDGSGDATQDTNTEVSNSDDWGSHIELMLRTHPATKERINYLKNEIAESEFTSFNEPPAAEKLFEVLKKSSNRNDDDDFDGYGEDYY